jgi:hypothetical protein
LWTPNNISAAQDQWGASLSNVRTVMVGELYKAGKIFAGHPAASEERLMPLAPLYGRGGARVDAILSVARGSSAFLRALETGNAARITTYLQDS